MIYDLTIAYDNDGGRTSRPCSPDGFLPRVIVRVDRFTKTPRDAKKWLFERWARKEERLAAGLNRRLSAGSGALVHVLFGAFIAALACLRALRRLARAARLLRDFAVLCGLASG